MNINSQKKLPFLQVALLYAPAVGHSSNVYVSAYRSLLHEHTIIGWIPGLLKKGFNWKLSKTNPR